jgi:hypothetical protein
MPAYGVEKPAPAKNRGWIIGAIVLLVILLLAAGAFVAFPKLFSTIFRNNGGQPSGPKANPTSQVEGAFPPTWTPEPVASPLPTNTKHPTPTALPSPTQYIMPTYDMTVVWMNAFASATAETYLTAVAALNTPEPGAVNAKPNNNGATVTPVPIDIACYADATSAHVTLTRVGKLVPFDGMNAFWVSPSANKAVRCNSPSNPTGEGMCSWDSADQYTSGITLTVQVVVEGSVLTCTSK